MLRISTSRNFSAEKTYVFSVLFGELLGVSYSVDFQEELANYQLQLPNGAALEIEDYFFKNISGDHYHQIENIPKDVTRLPHPFEPGNDIVGIYGDANFSQQENRIQCGIDLFASAFFMLSRWEEVARPERDKFGRFPAQYALAVQAGFLDRPVVNEYADFLWQMLVRLGWKEPRKKQHFKLHLSHDVDHPRLWWSDIDRLRTIAGSFFRKPGIKEANWWWKNHLFHRQDPYDYFDELMQIAENQGLQAHFNFLGRRPKNADCYYKLEHPFTRRLLQKITDRGHVIGFHPSREAFADPQIFTAELDSLRKIAPQEITSGRHHYLCFEAGKTWRRWSEAGLVWDSSAGYPEAEGFRCGICCEFQTFDFQSRKPLALREKPLIAMDVTLAQYRQYSPEQAFDRLVQLYRLVKKHRGEFVLLWHNSSFNTYFWAPWRAVYTDFVGQNHV